MTNATSISPHDAFTGTTSWAKLRQILVMLLAAACLLRVLPWYLARLNDGTDEPYGLLPLAAALWFAWSQRKSSSRIPAASTILLTCSGAAIVFLLPMPPMVRALAAVAVFASAMRIRQAAILGLLVLSLPVMASLQFYAGYPLRWLTAAGSQGILSVLQVECIRTGTVLTTPQGIVGVDPPCSGIRMLWTGCVLALLLMAPRRLSPRAVLAGLAAAVLLAITGNVLRAAILFFPESGAVHWPEWTHGGTGACLFALCTWVLVKIVDRLSGWKSKPLQASAQRQLAVFALPFAAALTLTATLKTGSNNAPAALPLLPSSFEGRPLVSIPLSQQEAAFARDFPGRLSVFTQDDRRIIWRDVTQPTRSLHSSLDCLRAAGWSVTEKPMTTLPDGSQWGCAQAAGPGQNVRVRERITDSTGRSWTDVSSWWWAATFGSTNGPWTAITVIEP